MDKKKILSIVVTLIVGFIIYYLTLPAINLSSPGFYAYIFFLIVFFIVIDNCNKDNITLITNRGITPSRIRNKGLLCIIPIIIILILLVNLACSPLFNASSYAKRITINQDHEFTNDVAEVDFNKIPLLDKDSSRKLGDRKMGEMSEWVSQFYVSDLYTQINYNDSLIRVTPIEYASFIKWVTNSKEGIKGYITVDSVTGSADLVTLDKGIKYTESAYFNEKLDRKLRFDYPTRIFGEKNFEIDNEGNPYWIVSTIKYTGIGLKPDVNSVIVLDAISGESTEYNVGEVPEWIDHVYFASLIIEQTDNWGEYKEGFFNSFIGQKNVVNTTEGYNYLAMNDDIFLYTGITSVSSDQSNLGFILTNLRTKETNYYAVAGAEEFSAMRSAEGLVQEKGYEASFPLLINLKGNPTYLLSLKDNAGLVKMYAFVDVVDYQKVTTSDSTLGIIEASKKYLNDFNKEEDYVSDKEDSIIIKTIKEVVINGNTYYYLTSLKSNKYVVNINVSKYQLPFLQVNDTIKVKYAYDEDEKINIITEIIE